MRPCVRRVKKPLTEEGEWFMIIGDTRKDGVVFWGKKGDAD